MNEWFTGIKNETVKNEIMGLLYKKYIIKNINYMKYFTFSVQTRKIVLFEKVFRRRIL